MDSQRSLQVGATVPEIVGLRSDGSTALLQYGEVNVPTVLYVFTPQCGWCKKNLANLHALIDQAGTRYRVIGIALTRQDLDAYVKNENLSLPVYSDIRTDIREAYQLGVTPETIIVSPESKVLKIWRGVFQESVKKDIERFLYIQLPGCCQ
jgi:peroxiredoxin